MCPDEINRSELVSIGLLKAFDPLSGSVARENDSEDMFAPFELQFER